MERANDESLSLEKKTERERWRWRGKSGGTNPSVVKSISTSFRVRCSTSWNEHSARPSWINRIAGYVHMRVHARLKSIPSLPSLSFSIALLPFHFSLSLNIILPLAYLPIEILRIFLFFLLNDWDRDKNYSWLERLDSVKREYKFDEFCISKKFLNSFLIFAFSFSLECFSPSTFFSLFHQRRRFIVQELFPSISME